MKRILSMVIALFLLSACDYGILWRDPPYEVYWIDNSSYELGYSIGGGGIISRLEYVTAIGSDTNFVTVQVLKPGSVEPEYYFIRREIDSAYKENSVKGPFSKEAYNVLKEKRNLPDFEKKF